MYIYIYIYTYICTSSLTYSYFNALSCLLFRFRVFHTVMMLRPERTESVVMAACILHNLLRARNLTHGEVDEEDPDTHELIPGSWRTDMPLSQVSMSSTRSTQAAKQHRDHFRDYFVSDAGSVPWQLAQI